MALWHCCVLKSFKWSHHIQNNEGSNGQIFFTIGVPNIYAWATWVIPSIKRIERQKLEIVFIVFSRYLEFWEMEHIQFWLKFESLGTTNCYLWSHGQNLRSYITLSIWKNLTNKYLTLLKPQLFELQLYSSILQKKLLVRNVALFWHLKMIGTK